MRGDIVHPAFNIFPVIPAKAGIHLSTLLTDIGVEMDSRLRGNDKG
jgi:hypothetical protein